MSGVVSSCSILLIVVVIVVVVVVVDIVVRRLPFSTIDDRTTPIPVGSSSIGTVTLLGWDNLFIRLLRYCAYSISTNLYTRSIAVAIS